MENGIMDTASEKEIAEILQHEYSQEDEREVLEILNKRTPMDKLWKIYKEYIDMHVILNDNLKKVMFHSLLGTMFTKAGIGYNESGNKKSVRFHAFIIQDSGTGKSHTFKVIDNLMTKFGVNSLLTINDTEATVTGTVTMDADGVAVTRNGLLSEKDAIIWDEGSTLLRDSPYSKNITDFLQMAMDEPGKVSKGLRLGRLEYRTNTTIMAGSYMFDEFKDTIMHKGFLQRMFVLCNSFTREEERKIRVGKNLLKNIRNVDRMEQLEKKMLDIITKCVDKNKKPLFFNVEDTKKFNVYLETIYGDYIDMQFNGEKQKVLKTFFNRVHTLIDKLATQHAIVNNQKEVMYEDMIYGAELIKLHLDSIHNIFDNISMKTAASPMERNMNIIRMIVQKNNNTMSIKELVEELGKLNAAGKWEFRYSKSMTLINKMLKDKRLALTKTASGKEVLLI